MTPSEKFCLKWNDFQENMASSFHGLRENMNFSDVTLVCDEDNQIEAHRVILSACSPFFSSVLKRKKHSHPMLYMRGLKSKDLVAIVDFMYHGEASIYQEDLNDFLALAEELQLKGLTGPNEAILEEKKDKLGNNVLTKPKKKTITKQESPSCKYEQIESIQQDNIVQDYHYEDSINDHKSIVPVESSRIVVELNPNNEGLKVQLESFMENINDGESNKWKCTVCGKTAANKKDIRRHVECHIEGVSHPCNLCGKVSRSSNALVMHVATYHRN